MQAVETGALTQRIPQGLVVPHIFSFSKTQSNSQDRCTVHKLMLSPEEVLNSEQQLYKVSPGL